MNPMFLIRMKRLVQHPPSKQKVILVGAVLVFCIGLFALEQFGLLPDWVSAERVRIRP